MRKSHKVFVVIGFVVLVTSLSFSISFAHGSPNSPTSDSDKLVEELKTRLEQLEPPKPSTIVTTPEDVEKEKYYPADTIGIAEVIKKGEKIPFKIIKADPNYKRPIYEEHWHSTYSGGRWAYIPMRIQYALHRMFTTYDIGLSALYDFQHNTGIEFPLFQNKTDLDLYIIVFQTNVTDAYTKGNQIVIVGSPARQGFQVITIKTKDLKPSDLKKLLVVQLATSNGDELDYSLINYEPPDFWIKQIQQAEERTR